MRPICEVCRRRDGDKCSEDGIVQDAYGHHYQGANCIHREKLRDLFLPLQTMGEVVDVVRELESRILSLNDKNRTLESTNNKLCATIIKMATSGPNDFDVDNQLGASYAKNS